MDNQEGNEGHKKRNRLAAPFGALFYRSDREGNERSPTFLLINYLKDANCPTQRMTLFGRLILMCYLKLNKIK
jgi:hypothetical protein